MYFSHRVLHTLMYHVSWYTRWGCCSAAMIRLAKMQESEMTQWLHTELEEVDSEAIWSSCSVEGGLHEELVIR